MLQVLIYKKCSKFSLYINPIFKFKSLCLWAKYSFYFYNLQFKCWLFFIAVYHFCVSFCFGQILWGSFWCCIGLLLDENRFVRNTSELLHRSDSGEKLCIGNQATSHHVYIWSLTVISFNIELQHQKDNS